MDVSDVPLVQYDEVLSHRDVEFSPVIDNSKVESTTVKDDKPGNT